MAIWLRTVNEMWLKRTGPVEEIWHRHIQEQEGDLSICRYITLIQSWNVSWTVYTAFMLKSKKNLANAKISPSNYSTKRLLEHWFFSKKKKAWLLLLLIFKLVRSYMLTQDHCTKALLCNCKKWQSNVCSQPFPNIPNTPSKHSVSLV